MSRGLKFLLWSPLWILGMLVALFLALKPLAAAAVNKIPRSAEAELGNILWKTTSSRMILEPEVPKEQREKLDKAWQRLLPQVKDSGYDFKLHLVQDNTPNAFALPGGHMAVHTGLLKLASTPEQVAGVLSHEIAHITLRHSLRNIVQEAGLQATLGILLGGTDLSGLGEVAGSLKSLQYGREMEREADEQGFEYLLAAKIDPSGLIQFFELLRQESAGGPEMPSLLSTHPATQERIARLQELLHQIPKDFQPHPL
jgi:predicted Zn-dependent protease